ncbi:hypothetical protein QQP08_025234 [Theobroma cacao]|nr:hypothetical protein QQP08_025234 [Theobroma cacao]
MNADNIVEERCRAYMYNLAVAVVAHGKITTTEYRTCRISDTTTNTENNTQDIFRIQPPIPGDGTDWEVAKKLPTARVYDRTKKRRKWGFISLGKERQNRRDG